MSKPELPSYQTFDSLRRVLRLRRSRCVPAAHHHNRTVEGVLRVLGTLILALQDPGSAVGSSETAPPSDSTSSRSCSHASPVVKLVLVTLLLFSAASWGIIVFKHLQLRRAARADDRRSSRCSARAAGSRKCRRSARSLAGESARRPVSGRLRGAERAAAQRRPSGKPEPAAPASNLEEPGGGRSRAAARVDDRDREARTSRVVSGDDGVDHAVHRPVRHGVGDHDGVSGHRRRRLDEPRRRVAPGIAEALDRDGARDCSRRFRPCTSTTTSRASVKKFANEMDDFSMEFLTIAERNFT